MSERIEVGDLVMVVRWPCCGFGLGSIGHVSEIFTARNLGHQGVRCDNCSRENVAGADDLIADIGDTFAPVAWLRKIPPLADLESIDTKEEIPA